MKRVLIIITSILLMAYIVTVICFFSDKKTLTGVCKGLEIIIEDSLERKFLSKNDIEAYLKKTNNYPVGKKIEDINTQLIENTLQKNDIIEKAEVVKTISGEIIVIISQKMPILRVFSSGGNYFVDANGLTMPIVDGHAIYVPIANGNIDKSFAVNELYGFSLFLQKNDFWNDLIEQIYVKSKDNIVIVPRVGGHQIILGSLDGYEEKLERLQLFYSQVIPKTGWDKYSIINLKYRNQIVCTKNKKTEL